MPNNPTSNQPPLPKENNALSIHPGAIPSTPILWPVAQHPSNQIQQTKGSAKPQATGVQPTTQPNQSVVAPRTTPAHVSNVRVVSRNVGGQKNITVQFNHPSGDPYFSGAKVYLRSGTKEPVLVASGAKSPLTFTATNDSAPHAIHVTSTGNWGETDVLTSPSAPVKLFGPLNVAKQPSAPVGAGGGAPTPPPATVSDGLIHGDSIWVLDPAYISVRDDFLHPNLPTGGSNFTSQLPWQATTSTNWFAVPSFGGMAQGLIQFPANGTATNGAMIAPGDPQTNANASMNTYSWFDSPGWKIDYVFSLSRGLGSTNSTQAPAFSMTQVSFYLGLANYVGINGFPSISSATLRPPTFFGLRYDTDTTAPAISDTQFVFEAVRGSATQSGATRVNTQGTTVLTGIVPTEYTEYRLEILCTVAGQATVTLSGGGVSFSSSLSMPVSTIPGGFVALAANGLAVVSSEEFQPWAAGTKLTITGATNEPGLNGTWPLIWSQGQTTNWVSFLYSGATFVQENETGSLSAFAAMAPFITFGNDTTATPVANSKALNLDYYAFVKNVGVGGGSGTPNPKLARYF